MLRGALALGLAISCSSEPGEPTAFVESPILTGCGAASLAVTGSPVTFAPGDRREYIVPSALTGAMGDGRITFTLNVPADAGSQPPVVVCNYVYGSGGTAPLQACTTTPVDAIVAGAGSGLLADSVLLERVGPGGGFGVALSWTKDDRNGCTDDACNGNQAPTHNGNPSLAGTVCGATDLCRGPSTCNANGECVAGQPIDTNDLDPCTADSCDPSTGVKHAFSFCSPPSGAGEGNLVVPTTFANSVGFVATQQDAGADALDPNRTAVLRGRVFEDVAASKVALSGVNVRALGQAALGSATTSANGNYTGWFDFAVNGGGDVILVFEKSGYLPVQRQVEARWNDTTVLDDVVMIPENTATDAPITQNSPNWQKAVGAVSPAEGTTPARKAVAIFAPGWSVSTAPDSWPGNPGTPVTIRTTEYTTGPLGPQRMPGDLPAGTGYTYATEFVVKEARDQGVASVRFTNDVISYVEAVTPEGGPDGGVAGPGQEFPVGTYDRARGLWVGESAGRIVRYTGQTNGLADLDCGSLGCFGGDGGAGLGIQDGERQQLATVGYSAGQLLWRVVQPHFSPWDYNWSFGPPAGAKYPPEAEPTADVAVEDPVCRAGSIIECENRILRESIPIAGTPYALHYSSERQAGYRQQITVPITDATPPDIPEFKRVEYDVQIAGQRYFGQRPAGSLAPNDRVVISWDRRDGWGRRVQGTVLANVKLAYVYTGVTRGGGGWAATLPGGTVWGDRANREIKLYRYFNTKVALPQMDAKPLGFGGWTFGPDHILDPVSGTAYFGDGSRRNATAVSGVIASVAGFGTTAPAEGQPALGAAIQPMSIAVAPDGAVFMGGGNSEGTTVKRVDPQTGLLSYVLGYAGAPSDETACAQIQDGQSAASVRLYPESLTVAPDGALYIAARRQLIYRIVRDPQAGLWRIYRAVGTCLSNGSGDLGGLGGVAAMRDGSIVYHARSQFCFKRVTPEGTSSTFAGICGTSAPGLETLQSGSAFVALRSTGSNYSLAAAPDGSVYAGLDYRLIRIEPGGTMTVVTHGSTGGDTSDGRPAKDTYLGGAIRGLALASDGSLYVAHIAGGSDQIRRVSPGSIVSTVVGGGTGSATDGALAAGSVIDVNTDVTSIAVGPDGTLFWNLYWNSPFAGIRKTRNLSPQGAAVMPGPEGTLEFCPDGRLLRTLSPLHGTPLLTFVRDTATTCNQTPGLLTIFTDLLGTTNISRSSSQVTIAPPNNGPTTTITLGSNGYATQISNGAQSWQVTHKDNGLLETLRDPNNRLHTFVYDGAGRLLADKNPLGGTPGTQLEATIEDRKRTVRVTSPEGRVATHVIDMRGVPGTNVLERRTNTHEGIPGSSVTDKIRGGTIKTRALDQAQATIAEGTVTQASDTGRWFMLAPWVKRAEEKRGTFTRAVDTTTHSVTLTGADPRYVAAQTDVWHVAGAASGKDATAIYSGGEQASSTWTLKSPERSASSLNGTETQIVTDSFDRPTIITRMGGNPTLDPVEIHYGAGRVSEVSQGMRRVTMGYSGPWLSSVTTTGLGTVTYGLFDAIGRASKVYLPAVPGQPREVALGYDAVGNVTSLEVPRANVHGFTPSAVDLLQTYVPPGTLTPKNTGYTYDRDSLLLSFAPPAQSAVTFARDAAGRVAQRVSPQAVVDFGYDPGNGKLLSASVQGGVANAFTYCGSGGTTGPTGLLCKETVTNLVASPKAIEYAYDARMRLASRTLEGRVVGYQYDDDDRLVAVTLGTSPAVEILRLTYSSSGFLSSVAAKNGTYTRTETYTYENGTGDLLQIADATTNYALDYTREDTTGRITNWKEKFAGVTVSNRDLQYDTANRLVREQYVPWPERWFNYDAQGNLDSSDQNTKPTQGAVQYDAQDRLIAGGGWPTWTYSNNGDLASVTNGSWTYTWTYDAFGNLRASAGPGRNLEYKIDAFDRRVEKKSNGVAVERYLYDASGRMVAWYDGAGSLKGQFVYATKGHVPDVMIDAAGGVHRIVTDHLGSVRLVYALATPTVAEQRMDCDALGNPYTNQGSRMVPFGFAGGLWDPDLGMVRFGARDYDVYKGRWATKDRSRFGGGLNFYQYAYGDPINAIDPSGFNVSPQMSGWAHMLADAAAGWHALAAAEFAKMDGRPLGGSDGAAIHGVLGALAEVASILVRFSPQIMDGIGIGVSMAWIPPTNPPQAPFIPDGFEPEPLCGSAGQSTGVLYRTPGTTGDANTIRIMRPDYDPRYPNGYWVQTSKNNQPLNPATGRPGNRGETHVPLPKWE